MSDPAPATRPKTGKIPPQPLRLTGREAEVLNAAVQRIIRSSETVTPAHRQSEKKPSRR